MMTKRFETINGKTADIIDAVMSSTDIPSNENLRFKIRLAVEEAVENIVQYAYPNGQGWINITTDILENNLVITLQDGGIPFNPLDKEDPDLTISADERQIGGLGIFLCKQLMDDVSYTYSNKQNTLQFKIKIK